LAYHSKKKKTKNKKTMEALMRRTTFAKAYGIKVRHTGNCPFPPNKQVTHSNCVNVSVLDKQYISIV
jgi:hypothetical protein